MNTIVVSLFTFCALRCYHIAHSNVSTRLVEIDVLFIVKEWELTSEVDKNNVPAKKYKIKGTRMENYMIWH